MQSGKLGTPDAVSTM